MLSDVRTQRRMPQPTKRAVFRGASEMRVTQLKTLLYITVVAIMAWHIIGQIPAGIVHAEHRAHGEFLNGEK